jgi:poly(hydroxyalkanoate) depolymerase family esterase
MTSLRIKIASVIAAVLSGIAGAVILTAPASAANLVQVGSFGSNPGNLAMYHYKPDGLPNGRPAVVLLHGCTQNATGYFNNSGWRKYADLYGFSLIVPQTSSANQPLSCFNWFELGDISRGQGEAASIRNMVTHSVNSLGTDASRVFVNGLSAGGAMAAVMLSTYPDVFKAGSIAAGIPYKCATSSAGTSSCQYSGVEKSPQQWGDLARGGYSGYGGPFPRVSIWHGSSDSTVVPKNATELIDQWTNVRGVSQTPTSTQSLPSNTTLQVFGNNDVRYYRVQGMAHGLPIDPGSGAQQCGTAASYFLDTICSAYYDAAFFGLTGGTQPPSPTASPTASPTSSPTPSPTPSVPPVCVTSSNYTHVVAGRAYHSLGYAYANGSNQRMGLYNTFYTTALKQTGPNYWVIGC